MSGSLRVNEIYLSIQGESTHAGLPCVFVRLTGCPLRCSYCDTAYAFTGGTRHSVAEVVERVHRLAAPYENGTPRGGRLPLVELTGGEPLAQAASLPLMTELCNAGFTVLLETSGALDIRPVDPRVHRIVDLKCPSSGEDHRNRWDNLADLRPIDEIKFVIGTREDYAWVRDVIREHRLAERCPLLVSWVHPLLSHQSDPALKPVPEGHHPITRPELVALLLEDALPVRFQAQLHKIIWPPDQRGV